MTDTTWGMRFNEYPDHQRVPKGQISQGCPEWLEKHQIRTWQEQGLVVWNNLDRKIEAFHGRASLRLLDKLTSQDDWKSDGVSITRSVHWPEFESPPRARRKKKESQPGVETAKPEHDHREIMHLPPQAGTQLIELLEAKKHILTEMADREKKHFEEAVRQLLESVVEFSRKKEVSEFNFQTRLFEWHEDSSNFQWVCQHQSAQGRVWLGKSKAFWNTCVKREDHSSRSHYFAKLPEAVEWVEKEIRDLANEPEPEPEFQSEQQIEADRIRLRKKLIGSPYWIDSAAFEPEQVTYNIYIELEAKPVSWETFESICGDPVHYAERYLSPAKLADALHLDLDHFNIEQPIGENTDWYRITSLTIYYQESSAAEQAQKAWDQSRILGQFKEGKIARARYGYKEVQTGFDVFLGDCAELDKPWRQPVARKDFLKAKALRESLAFALDITDYRDFLGVSANFSTNERILRAMHRIRKASKHVSEEVRRESKVWLAEHEPLD